MFVVYWHICGICPENVAHSVISKLVLYNPRDNLSMPCSQFATSYVTVCCASAVARKVFLCVAALVFRWFSLGTFLCSGFSQLRFWAFKSNVGYDSHGFKQHRSQECKSQRISKVVGLGAVYVTPLHQNIGVRTV